MARSQVQPALDVAVDDADDVEGQKWFLILGGDEFGARDLLSNGTVQLQRHNDMGLRKLARAKPDDVL